MSKHKGSCYKSDRTGTYKTKEFGDGTEWTYTRCNNCSAVLKIKEKGHWLFGIRDKRDR